MKLIGIGALIDNAWEHYRTHFPKLMKVSAWLLVIVLINIIAISVYPFDLGRETRALTGLEIFGVLLFVINNTILGYVIFRVWIMNALVDMVDKQHGGTQISMNRLSKRAWKNYLPQLVVHIVMGIIFLLASALPFGIYAFITFVLGGILPAGITFLLLILALLLFLVPIALLIYFVFAPYSVVLEGKRHIEAIKHSVQMVHARFWPVAWRIALPKILYFSVLLLLQWLVLALLRAGVLGVLQGADLVTLARVDSVISMVSYAALIVLIYPMMVITDYLVYKNIRGN